VLAYNFNIMIIFCDGVFDLFHEGHVKHFKKIKYLYPDSYLFVGVLNDQEATDYKRNPVFNENQRLSLVYSCKYVDKVTIDYPVIMTEEFMAVHKIDLVVHAFSNMSDYTKQLQFFEVPVRLNKMKIIDYNEGISTTNIINDINSNNRLCDSDELKNGWDKIWELKGKEQTNNYTFLNGYEDTDFSYNLAYKNIVYTLDIKPESSVLEVGCGAGQFSKLFDVNFDYYGVDYSRSQVNRNISFTNCKVVNFEAIDLPFKDNYFDYCFGVCVFEYFSSKEYGYKVLKELERVTKKGIYIVNIRNKTHDAKPSKYKYDIELKHNVYDREDFETLGYTICDATYENEVRFSAFKML
jgi:cytidyltransferase-like protein